MLLSDLLKAAGAKTLRKQRRVRITLLRNGVPDFAGIPVTIRPQDDMVTLLADVGAALRDLVYIHELGVRAIYNLRGVLIDDLYKFKDGGRYVAVCFHECFNMMDYPCDDSPTEDGPNEVDTEDSKLTSNDVDKLDDVYSQSFTSVFSSASDKTGTSTSSDSAEYVQGEEFDGTGSEGAESEETLSVPRTKSAEVSGFGSDSEETLSVPRTKSAEVSGFGSDSEELKSESEIVESEKVEGEISSMEVESDDLKSSQPECGVVTYENVEGKSELCEIKSSSVETFSLTVLDTSSPSDQPLVNVEVIASGEDEPSEQPCGENGSQSDDSNYHSVSEEHSSTENLKQQDEKPSDQKQLSGKVSDYLSLDEEQTSSVEDTTQSADQVSDEVESSSDKNTSHLPVVDERTISVEDIMQSADQVPDEVESSSDEDTSHLPVVEEQTISVEDIKQSDVQPIVVDPACKYSDEGFGAEERLNSGNEMDLIYDEKDNVSGDFTTNNVSDLEKAVETAAVPEERTIYEDDINLKDDKEPIQRFFASSRLSSQRLDSLYQPGVTRFLARSKLAAEKKQKPRALLNPFGKVEQKHKPLADRCMYSKSTESGRCATAPAPRFRDRTPQRVLFREKKSTLLPSSHVRREVVSQSPTPSIPLPKKPDSSIKPRWITIVRHGYKPRRIFHFFLNQKNIVSLDYVFTKINTLIKLDSGPLSTLYCESGIEVQSLWDFFGHCFIFFAFPKRSCKWEEFLLSDEEQAIVEKMNKVVPQNLETAPLPYEIEAKFDVTSTIHCGCYSIVKECEEKSTGEKYALKVVVKMTGNEMLESWTTKAMNEIDILKGIDHPNIITVSVEFVTANKLFLVMDLIQSGNLDVVMQSEQLVEFEILSFISDVASALFYLHLLGIIHRDITPERLMVVDGPRRKLKLCDFGLATTEPTPLHDACSLMLYAAPEMLARTGYDDKVDVWAAGVVFYKVIAKRMPFQSADVGVTQRSIMKSDVKFDEDVWNLVSQGTKHLISMMMHRDPEKRFSANDVLDYFKPRDTTPVDAFLDVLDDDNCRSEGTSDREAEEENDGYEYTEKPELITETTHDLEEKERKSCFSVTPENNIGNELKICVSDSEVLESRKLEESACVCAPGDEPDLKMCEGDEGRLDGCLDHDKLICHYTDGDYEMKSANSSEDEVEISSTYGL